MNKLAALEAIVRTTPRGPRRWEELARISLESDMGKFGDWPVADYQLDNASRDRLIAHARQDAAMIYHALLKVERDTLSARIWSWLTFLISLVILYKVW